MNLKKPLADLDQIKTTKELTQTTLAHIHAKQKKAHRKTPFALAIAACVVLLCISVPLFQNHSPTAIVQQVYTYVSFDINPSIELQLNEEQMVIDTKAYNEDGETLLSQLALQNHSLQEAIDLLIENELFQSYMETGYLQVSVFSQDTQHSITLENEIDQTLSHHYGKDQYGCTCASKRDHESASSHHMSIGRYQMMEDIIAIDPTQTIESLQGKTMRELKNLYEQLTQNKQDNRGHHHGRRHDQADE